MMTRSRRRAQPSGWDGWSAREGSSPCSTSRKPWRPCGSGPGRPRHPADEKGRGSVMMDRRRFLGVVTKTVAGGLLAGDALAAPVQGVTPLRSKDGGGEGPGVAGREIRIGMSAAFKGTAGGLGTEFYRGAQAFYQDLNGRGGVHG